ncbi:MAG: glucose-6-phosphate dehydrogenase [Mobilicoccus sp.]|nr:glucose-6-phosphate dehydrogenase [Mobilicoccus sp.]
MSPARVTRDRNPLRDPGDLRLPRIAGPCALVLFGVTGDLARKKLLPAVYDLASRGLLPPGFALIGFGRREWSHADFADEVREAVTAHARTEFDEEVFADLADGLRFVTGAFDDDAAFDELAAVCEEVREGRGTGGNVAFYLSIPPGAFPDVCRQLQRSGLATGRDAGGADGTDVDAPWRRVVIEKPFGHDLRSARELNDVVEGVFSADAIFRIDHYLGKETVQNLLALRFANQLFEPLWNAAHVDHVQITMAEDVGIGGRAGYYDGIGAARDVIQNHLLQLLALTAMEEPLSFSAAHLRAEKEKVLEATRLAGPVSRATARGVYTPGWQGGERVIGYREEEGVPTTSATETYAALALEVRTRRWAGVPFYLRTGKRLPKRVTEIAVVFRKAPHDPFDAQATEQLGANAVVIRVQPDEGITLRFGAKVPGAAFEVRDVSMDFGYGRSFTQSSPEAYERLILDVLLGEPPLFPRHREVEESWRILDPVTAAWARSEHKPEPYEAGTWGPASADDLLRRDGREWRLP